MGIRPRRTAALLACTALLVATLCAVPARAQPQPAATGLTLPLVLGAPLAPPLTVAEPFRPPAFRYGPGHRGVDLAAEPGDVIVAAGSGRVVYAAPLAGRGVVSLEHDGGLRTTYEPVTASVHAGDAVTEGMPIGRVEAGHPPCAPASCLHWGARLSDGTYLDPLALLRPWRVRLKPYDVEP